MAGGFDQFASIEEFQGVSFSARADELGVAPNAIVRQEPGVGQGGEESLAMRPRARV